MRVSKLLQYTEMKDRDTSLDVIRIVACLMVVLMHSPMPSPDANGMFLTALSYFTAPCIGLFFMVSGALLLPINSGYVPFIRKRFSKIIIPTLLWSLLYISLRLYNSESEINVLQSIASLPFSPQGNGVLWFMYTLSGLYLLAPILSAWIEKATKRELQIVLLLWLITLCYPLLNFYVKTDISTSGILYYFTGYAGYFLLGYYLKKYRTISALCLWLLAFAGVILLLALKYFNIESDFYNLFWYQSIFIAALAAAIWKTTVTLVDTVQIKTWTIKPMVTLSNLTFGIYLIHILIMRDWLWQLDIVRNISNYTVQSLAIALITFILSALVCRLLSVLPYSQWLIGYRTHKRKH